MHPSFKPVVNQIQQLLNEYLPLFLNLDNELISSKRNNQDRTIKQIIGHMVDSVSNNTHRIVHLQYQQCPFEFPNYATHGNNDRWIAIQHYQQENWPQLLQLWKYTHLHFLHIVQFVNSDKLNNEWIAGDGDTVTLEAMVVDFLRHFKLHISEINAIVKS